MVGPVSSKVKTGNTVAFSLLLAVSDYSMRYTNGVGKNKESNMNVQYLASQLGDLTG